MVWAQFWSLPHLEVLSVQIGLGSPAGFEFTLRTLRFLDSDFSHLSLMTWTLYFKTSVGEHQVGHGLYHGLG